VGLVFYTNSTFYFGGEKLMALRKNAHHKQKIISSIPHPHRLMLNEEGELCGGYF
jgi:hypothetical protein